MNILILCTKYSLSENDPWLTNELADSLQGQGHQIRVLVIDWTSSGTNSPRDFKTSTGVVVNLIPALHLNLRVAVISKLVKWVFSSFSASLKLRKELKDEKPDLVISFSPSVAMAFPVLVASQWAKTKMFLVQWDFFPFHHRQIGLLSSGIVFKIAKIAEEHLIRRFDVVGCLSERNIDYLNSHYKLKSIQKSGILPIWGKGDPVPGIDRHATRERYGLPLHSPLVVFGGQLAAGRGLEDLLEAAELSAALQSDIIFVVIGSGPFESLIRDYLDRKRATNLIWISRIPRLDYLGVIKACDLALVCTVRDVDAPSFPSKTIDYLRVGLPIIASVEKTSDYGDYIVSNGVGLSINGGNPSELHSAIVHLLADATITNRMKENGPLLFQKEFEVGVVAKKLLNLMGN